MIVRNLFQPKITLRFTGIRIHKKFTDVFGHAKCFTFVFAFAVTWHARCLRFDPKFLHLGITLWCLMNGGPNSRGGWEIFRKSNKRGVQISGGGSKLGNL